MKHHNVLITIILCFYCSYTTVLDIPIKSSSTAQTKRAKFEPPNGTCLFFIGQDMKATGGFNDYNNGYCDTFEVPAGITTYTNFAPGSSSFGYLQKGNDGIQTFANWGADYNCAQCYIEDPTFKNCALAIGVSMVGHEKKVATGKRDYLIRELAQWIKDSKRPIFLRIGYEFDGWEWNQYDRKQYLAAWKHIHTIFKEMEVNNVAFVWQSKGNGSGQDVLEKWYPGDDVVDWCGYSYFAKPDQEMLSFARRHKKPVFIAEATPVLQDENQFLDTQLTNSAIAKEAWEKWFVPFITTLNENKDVIKAFSYINANWSLQPMWINNPVFQKVDSRIQESDYISKKWQEEIGNPRYLKANEALWNALDYKK